MKRDWYLYLTLLSIVILFSSPETWAGDCNKAEKISREVSLYKSYDPVLAEKKLYEAVQLCEKSAALKYNLAIVLYKSKKYSAAAEYLEEAISLNPRFAKAFNALAFIYLKSDSGKHARALDLAKKAVELDPGNKEYRDTLARVKYSQFKPDTPVSTSKIKMPKYPPHLLMEVSIEEHNGNGIIEASEPAALKVKLRNSGQGEARKIIVSLKMENVVSGLSMQNSITVPFIAPESEEMLDFVIRTDEDELKTGTLSLLVSAAETNGFDADSVKISIATKAYDPPDLKVVDIGINDMSENGQIEPAEIVEITARIQNTGLGDARGVKAMVDMGKHVYSAGDTETEFDLQDLSSGEYKDIIFSIYTSRRAADIPVFVNITEDRPRYNRKYPLNLAFNRQEKKRLKEVIIAPEQKTARSVIETAPRLSVDIDLPPKTQADRPDAVAVVIGNKEYKNQIVPQVEFAIRDAAVMKQYLIDTLGFKERNIIYLQNADKTDFQKTFGDENDHRGDLYSRTRRGKSDIFIYYSGHGAPDSVTKKPYMVPANADPNSIKFTGYSLDTMYANLLNLSVDKQPKSLTVVIDACFSGTSNEGMIIQDASPIYMDIEMPLLQMENAVVFTSSKRDQISSWYREKRHGLFTYFFLKAIKDAVNSGMDVTARGIEAALVDVDSVNDFAWRLYKRKQEPIIMGNKNIILVDK